MTLPRLILASASPRRRELLHGAGYDFEVHPADVDEDDYPAKTLPADLAQLLANTKGRKMSDQFPSDVILAADTVVAFGDTPLGKADDDAAAFKMLKLLAGSTHIVVTGVCVIGPAKLIEKSARVMSAVTMRPLTDKQIQAYVDTGDWRGKAGAYGIQDDGTESFVTRVVGSRTNVVGLPMEKTTELLAAVGVRPLQPPAE